MKTRNSMLSVTLLTTVVFLGCTSAAFAQSDSQKNGTPAKQKKPAPKQHKVWTNDELATVRSPADAYIEAKQRQTDKSDAAVQPASDKQPASDAHKTYRSPLLSNPKTPADADRMIAWEQRDIAGQEEYIDSLKKEIADAEEGERKDRLLKVFQERQQILADTRKEMQDLQGDKAKLQKQESAQPPSQ
jgi:hypothetical protein